MIGFINKITATPGSRAALLALVVTGAEDMSGCIAYIAAGDGSDPDVIWVSEVWVDKASQEASLRTELVSRAIEEATPLIAGFENIAVLEHLDVAVPPAARLVQS